MANAKLGSKAVGSIVKLKVNGVAKEFIIVHQGKPSSIYDESCNGTWLLMKDIYENRQWHSSDVNVLETSAIHRYLNSTFLGLFDSDIQGVIKQVKIPYRKDGGSNGTTQQGTNGLPCKIFLLSATEVHFENTFIYSGEGAALSYFASCVTNNADPKRVAYLNGSATPWWLRSLLVSYIEFAWVVYPDGDCNNSGVSNSFGIRPALVLPQDMEVDSSGNVTPPPPATHKTLVNGTAYEVKGGKCLVNGTAYSIKKGRTLIGGTGYDITFAPPVNIYGVSWNGTFSPLLTRTDDAADFTNPVAYMAGISNYGSPFDGKMPWSGMTVVEDVQAGKLVKIPKFWYKLTQNGNGVKIQISDAAQDGFSVSPAHMNRGDGKGERDIVYVGRYHCRSNDYKSYGSETPKVNVTRASARYNIHNLGATVWQSDFAMTFTLWLLYIVEYANWNSQEVIGYGCGNNVNVGYMGYTDTMPYHTGTTARSRTAYGATTQYRNIEGLWDNCYEWMDGCYNNNQGMNVILNPASFHDSANGTVVGMPKDGWISAWSVKTISNLFPLLIPSAANGSQSGFVTDACGYSADRPCLFRGGGYIPDLGDGMFRISTASMYDTYPSVGCRLQKLP